jgi:hypothetical protein
MRNTTALVGAALVIALFAGCGGSSGQHVVVDATPAALRKSAEATLQKGTSKVEFTMDMSIFGQDLTLRGTGVMDPPHKRFQIDFDAKDLFDKILGAKGTPVPPDVAAALDHPLTEVLDGTVVYMHFPAFAAKTGKEWIKVDLAAVNSSAGELLGNGGGGAFGSDPTAFLQFLEGAGKVTRVDSEEVRGVMTTHFSGSYTLKDALASLSPDRRDAVEHAFAALNLPDSAQTQDIPFDAWVGDDGLVRKIETSFDASLFAPNPNASLGHVSLTLELFDFGTPADITVPSDDEVTDVSSLASSGASKFSSVASSIGN